MENIIYILFNLGFTLIFGALGVFITFTHVNDYLEVKNYKRAKRLLGAGFFLMTAYCLFRTAFPQLHLEDVASESARFEDFTILTIVSLIFSWFNYACFLHLIDTSHYHIKRFFIDGLAPLTILLIIAAIGYFKTDAQDTCIVLIGLTFTFKCIYMFYLCEKEYRKCVRDLDNYYDQAADIKWIRVLIWLTFFLSIITIIGFFVKELHYITDPIAPVAYIYMVIKIVNWGPKKVDKVRAKYAELTTPFPASPEAKEKGVNISTTVAPKLNDWVEKKHFCKSDLTIKDVASDMGTNHNYLSKYINNELGITFQVWLNTLRIEESKLLMSKEPKVSIEEIGQRVGFAQLYNFSRWFKQVTGETPFKWRKQHHSK